MGRIKLAVYCIVAAAFVVVMSGCVGSSLAKKEDVVYMETSVNREMASMRRDIDITNSQIEELRTEESLERRRLAEKIERLESRISKLEAQVGKTSDLQAALEKELKAKIVNGDKRVEKNVDVKLDKLLDVVVKENKKIVQQFNRRQNVPSKPAASPSSSSDTVQGYYHTIERGQSLSKIAAIYGVSMESILTENEITNPDKIRAGQQIFIPQED